MAMVRFKWERRLDIWKHCCLKSGNLESQKIKTEHDKIEKEMRNLGRRLMSQGMSPGDAMNDPRVLAMAKRKREIGRHKREVIRTT